MAGIAPGAKMWATFCICAARTSCNETAGRVYNCIRTARTEQLDGFLGRTERGSKLASSTAKESRQKRGNPVEGREKARIDFQMKRLIFMAVRTWTDADGPKNHLSSRGQGNNSFLFLQEY